MGKTFAEKIFSKAAGKDVVPGEIVVVTPHVAMSHDNTAAIARTFAEIGVEKVKFPEKHVVILDHCVPAANEEHAVNHREIREFVKKQGISRFHDISEGICHQVMIEKGYVLPGMLAVGSDSHTTTYGAVGAFSTGIGRSEMAVIFATGKIWFRVPESMMINLAGRFSHRFISAKDLALTIIGEIGCDGGLYRSIEFTGSARKYLSVGDRMVLCNLAAEMGAKNGVVIPDEITENYCYTATKNTCEPVLPDSDARYEIKKTYDLNEIEPVVACPPDVDNVKKISDVKGLKFHQALLGTCTNGRFEDLKIAADIVKGRKIHRNVRFLVLPASRQIYSHAMETGILSILYDSGAVILNPGCGPCLGAHQGILAPSEVCLSTANRNFKGRMGCKDAFVYLASPAVVAASAIAGEFVDPREI